MKNIKTKLALLAIGMILVTGYVSAGSWIDQTLTGADEGYSPGAATSETIEGGEITDLDIDQELQTDKWAAYYGNLTGSISLRNAADTYSVFNWAWDEDDSAEVCAIATAGTFDWSSVATSTFASIDASTAWNFSTSETDSGTGTYTEDGGVRTENYQIAGKATISTQSISTGPESGGMDVFETGILTDGGNTKANYAFCVKTNASSTNSCGTAGGCAYNLEQVNYELLIPTNEEAGQTEDYYFYVELN